MSVSVTVTPANVGAQQAAPSGAAADFTDDDFDFDAAPSGSGEASAEDAAGSVDDEDDLFDAVLGSSDVETASNAAAAEEAGDENTTFDPGTPTSPNSPIAPPGAILESSDLSDDVNEVYVVPVFEARCTRCSAFFPEHPKPVQPRNCHYTDGNTECPAANVKIVIGLDVDAVASRILKAERARDAARVAKLMARLAERAPEVQQQVLQVLDTLRRS